MQKSKWNRVADHIFQFKNGDQITIERDDSLEKVVTKMAQVEFDGYIDASTPGREVILDVVEHTIQKYFKT